MLLGLVYLVLHQSMRLMFVLERLMFWLLVGRRNISVDLVFGFMVLVVVTATVEKAGRIRLHRVCLSTSCWQMFILAKYPIKARKAEERDNASRDH